MKKIGILTMHKVQNYGSALQAYALQHYLSLQGHDVKLIDYIFPNGKRKLALGIKEYFIKYIVYILTYKNIKTKNKRFQSFYKEYFICTDKQYNSPEELGKSPHDYDTIITGSDQVWNPKHIKDDLSFFLPFVDTSIKKISYASSFSTAIIPEQLNQTIKEHLLSYQKISVREKSGIEIVKKLTGKDINFVCDPTLLLTRTDWCKLAEKADKNLKLPTQGYILVYLLRYAYDPYPYVVDIVNKVQDQLHLPIVALDPSIKESNFDNCISISDAGPLEFLKLVKNASFVITSSFHGTAFSLNFGVPFFSVIKERSNFDTRMTDLLDKCGADRDIIYNRPLNKGIDMDYSLIKSHIDSFRKESMEYLNKII